MIRSIVSRLHVSASYLTVARMLVKAVKGGFKGWMKYDRKVRRDALREAFRCHKANRKLYNCVATGVF